MKENEHVVAVAGKYHMTGAPWKLFGSDMTLEFAAKEAAPSRTRRTRTSSALMMRMMTRMPVWP